MGGLSKKAYQIDSIRAENSLPSIAVDGGALLFSHGTISPGAKEQAKTTAGGIVESYNLMGYVAVGVANQDLAAGLEFLQTMQQKSKFAWLSANLVNKDSGEPIFTNSIIREVGGLRIGITGLTGPPGPLTLTAADNARILPWRDTLPDVVRQLNQKCDLIILLSNETVEQNRAIAAAMKNIHLIIQAGVNTTNLAPQLTHNTLISQTGKQGKYLGWLHVNWKKSRTWGKATNTEQLTAKQNELDGIRWRLERLEQRLPAEERRSHGLYAKLVQKREQLVGAIAEIKADLARSKGGDGLPSTYTSRFVSMKVALPDDEKVLQVVEATKARVNKIGKLVAKRTPGTAAAKGKTYAAADLPLVGWRVCSTCHPGQTAFWQTTKHNQAFQTLIDMGQNFNLDCLPCHVTFSPGDMPTDVSPEEILLALPESLQLVGCETCHGPGVKHRDDPAGHRMKRMPAEILCQQCHTPEQDPSFDFSHDLPLAGCPAVNVGTEK